MAAGPDQGSSGTCGEAPLNGFLSQAAAEALSGCTDDSVKKTYLTTVKPDHAARVLGFMSPQGIALVLAPAPQSVRVPILAALSKNHPDAFQARDQSNPVMECHL
jgi:hypothetical protein